MLVANHHIYIKYSPLYVYCGQMGEIILLRVMIWAHLTNWYGSEKGEIDFHFIIATRA